ncbi:MAG: ABC transporter ATP-binding protein [Acidobacteria bacterium]|nr:MAG: ABC transporter ATP-binding protein [Acidobacteriota bacterium]
MKRYRGVGLIVSQDRSLLDSLCRQCLFVDPDYCVLRPGTYTEGRVQAEREEASAHRQRELAKEKSVRLERSVVWARQEANRSSRKATKRALAARDHDARAKVDLARVTGRDAAVVRRVRQLERRLERESERRDNTSVRRSYSLGVWTEGEASRRDTLFHVPAGSLSLGSARRLVYPDLVMFPTDRIALTGANGSGKTSLIRVILQRLNVIPERLVYLPQEIDAVSSSRTIDQVRHLSHEELGYVMSLVTRLGSNPDRLMETTEPSPGEMRKVLLAMGLAKSPQLIILDEPTNHLDLPSIECMERALAECSCGLLLVSHDDRFLEALTTVRWRNEADSGDPDYLVLTVG